MHLLRIYEKNLKPLRPRVDLREAENHRAFAFIWASHTCPGLEVFFGEVETVLVKGYDVETSSSFELSLGSLLCKKCILCGD